jgi:cytochrome P450
MTADASCAEVTAILDKREEPADDLISVLIDARDSDGKLSEAELVQVPLQPLAGHESTANSINMSFVALCQYPDELARLRANPDLIPTAVEELLRYVNISGSAFVPLARVTREDVCLGGVRIPAGETVLLRPAHYLVEGSHAAALGRRTAEVGRPAAGRGHDGDHEVEQLAAAG